MKIAIIGNPGSGKSTLALKLHQKLKVPLYHLDQYDWQPGWSRINRSEFISIHNKLCDQDQWIIEGVATRLFEYRAIKADIIIFLDKPTYICLYRVLKRALIYFNKEHFASPRGCKEGRPSITFLKYIWNFNRDKKPEVEAILKKYKTDKKIFIIKSSKECDQVVKALSKDK